MTPNPFSDLLHSRKFWLMVLDLVVSMTLYFAAKYAGPAEADIRTLVLAFQPVFVTVIAALAYENGKGLIPPSQQK